MLSAIIVEDELLAAERLAFLLKECGVAMLKKFSNAPQALAWLKNHEVDLACVDIGLPEVSGLELVEQIKRHSKSIPHIIFVTAYEEYALDAFDLAAMDYLLKPVKLARLREAISRVEQTRKDKPEDEFVCFNVTNRNMAIQVPWQQAAYLQADQKDVFLYTNAGERYTLQKTLIFWEQRLGDKCVRVHRNALIMRHAFDRLVRLDDAGDLDENVKWGVKLIDLDVILPVSRRQLTTLRKELNLIP